MTVFEIFYMFSSSKPPLIGLLILLQRVNAREQPIVEQRIWFPQIDYIDLDGLVFGKVAYPEVKPLSVALCVEIVLE